MNNSLSNISIRVDKNLSSNFLHFRKYSSDDSNLIFLLLAYFAKERQNNLFGFGTLDPIQFCKELNLTPEHIIWRKHLNPKQFEKYTQDEIENNKFKKYDTILENALYCLSTDVYDFTQEDLKYIHKSQINIKTEKLFAIQFLKSFERVTITNNRGQERRIYNYTLSQEFLDNLSFIFFHTNPTNLSLAYKKNFEGLYLFLCNVKNELFFKRMRVYEDISFDFLKELLQIDSDNHKYVKQKISKAFDTVLQYNDLIDHLSYEWYKSKNHNHKYTLKLVYLKPLVDKKIQEVNSKIKFSIKHNYLRTALFENYKRRYPQYDNNDILKSNYIKWLQNTEIDEDLKKSTYITACVLFDERNKHIQTGEFFNSFLKELPIKYLEYL